MKRILIVDDETNVLSALVRALRLHRDGELEFETFSDPYEALKRCSLAEFDVVISDFNMPQMTGVELLSALKQIAPDTVRMMLSAATEFATVSSAINEAEVFRYIAKPWDTAQLMQDIDAALAQRERLTTEPPPPPTPQEREERDLESEEPGILKVKWGPNGEIIL
ncbi:MAG TPA: response regulator [Telluria sp.]|nr:response regulator [Telluria sp.]